MRQRVPEVVHSVLRNCSWFSFEGHALTDLKNLAHSPDTQIPRPSNLRVIYISLVAAGLKLQVSQWENYTLYVNIIWAIHNKQTKATRKSAVEQAIALRMK